MSLAENLLDTLPDTAAVNESGEEGHIVIDAQRRITVPNELKLIAVKGDQNVETVTIDCVRYWDEHDLSEFEVKLYYITPSGETKAYNAEDIVVGDDIFSFNWTIGREITLVSGKLTFWLVAKKFDENDTLLYQWSSLQNSDCTVANGGDISSEPASSYEGFFDGSSNELTLENITKLRPSVFYSHDYITKIDIPNVETIGENAFWQCHTLKEALMPKVKVIGKQAFYYCENLETATLPNSLIEISESAFALCHKLVVTKLPNNLQKIDGIAFSKCYEVNFTTIPASVKVLGNLAFGFCTSLTNITFQGTPTTLSSAFEGCENLTVINVPWAEGAIAGAPWGASNATINYNYRG